MPSRPFFLVPKYRVFDFEKNRFFKSRYQYMNSVSTWFFSNSLYNDECVEIYNHSTNYKTLISFDLVFLIIFISLLLLFVPNKYWTIIIYENAINRSFNRNVLNVNIHIGSTLSFVAYVTLEMSSRWELTEIPSKLKKKPLWFDLLLRFFCMLSLCSWEFKLQTLTQINHSIAHVSFASFHLIIKAFRMFDVAAQD